MNHRAIAGLVGYSWEPLELALELVPHGDLYSFLHNPDNQISWPFRFKMVSASWEVSSESVSGLTRRDD